MSLKINLQEKRNNLATWVFNPFLFWGGSKALWIGLLVVVIHIPLGYFFQIRFDGALDMHLGTVDNLVRSLIDIVIAWVSMFSCMYISGKLFDSPIRFLDVAGATAIARVPLLLAIIPARVFFPKFRNLEEFYSMLDNQLWIFVTGTILLLIILIWFFVLLFNAYKVNSNLRGWKLGVGFITAVIAAEIMSMVLLQWI